MARFLLTLASADFCSLTNNRWQTSQGKCIRFPFMWPLQLRSCVPYSIGLLFLMQHHPYNYAFMQFLFVSPNVCLLLPSDSTSRWTPLHLAKTSYCKASSGLAPYS